CARSPSSHYAMDYW
nr:immunoglobulin heavy chain junction region [Mus musculus]MBK4185875.1 immunoglobulin heavy chain junction region [Mus musculus]